MNSAAEMKKRARALAAQRLAALSPDDFRRIGAKMAVRILRDPWYLEAESVFCFAGTGAEADTGDILRRVLADGKILCMPRCGRGGLMTARRVRNLSSLRPGVFSIPEPPEDAPCVPKQEIGLILVPCLAAAPGGVRLGRGGGYYDRYLADYGGRTIILCPRALIMDALPTEENDVPADRIMTEDGEISSGGVRNV